jgi:hypothetical protein
MGFKPFKAVTRALGIPDKAASVIGTVIMPVAKLGDLTSNALANYVTSAVQPEAKAQVSGLSIPYPGATYNVYQGGYAEPPAYSVYFAEEGRHTPWDYSTDSSPMSSGMSWADSPMISPSAPSWEMLLQASFLNP